MIAVIFEVWLPQKNKEAYLTIANRLKKDLEVVDGFISIERFVDINDAQKLLSISFWRDEQAIKSWRTFLPHKDAQTMGRNRLFENYRLRVAHVIRDYGKFDRKQAPYERD